MSRFSSHKWWARILALQLALVLAGTLMSGSIARAGGKYELDVSGPGGSTGSGDPDVPTAPSARSGMRTDGAVLTTEGTNVTSVDGDSSAWVIRLRFVMQSLRAYALRF